MLRESKSKTWLAKARRIRILAAVGLGLGLGTAFPGFAAQAPTDTPTLFPTEIIPPTNTPTKTNTPTVTPTHPPPPPRPTPTWTGTPTNTGTITNTPTITDTGTDTDTPNVTATFEASSFTPTDSPTPTDTSTATNTPTDTPTRTDTRTPANTPTLTNTPTITYTPTITDTSTITSTPTITPTQRTRNIVLSNAVTNFVGGCSPTYTSTGIPTSTSTATASTTSTSSATASATGTPTVTASETPTSTASSTTTSTPSSTGTSTASSTGTSTFSATATATSTFSVTSSVTSTATSTFSETSTASSTSTNTFSPTWTASSTSTPSFTATSTATSTAIPTSTFSSTPSSTFTFVPTATASNTPTETYTFTMTATPSLTLTPTSTATPSFTPTATSTATATPTATSTPSFTATASATSTPSTTSTFTPTATSTFVITLGKKASSSMAQSGKAMTYTLSLDISGTTASGVTIVDTLPAPMTYLGPGANSPSSLPTPNFSPALDQLVWLLPPMSPGSYQLSYQVVLNNLVSGGSVLTNSAVASSAGSQAVTATAQVVAAAAYSVKLGVYNEAGELVESLANEQLSSAVTNLSLQGNSITELTGAGGAVSIYFGGTLLGVWNGTNSSGALVTNGVYYVQVENVDGEGNVTTVTQKVAVSRNFASAQVEIYNEAGEVVRHLYLQITAPVGSEMTAVQLSSQAILPATNPPNPNSTVQITLQTSNGPVTLSWDGTDDAGARVTAGRYEIHAHWNDGKGVTTDVSQDIIVMGGNRLDKVVAEPNLLTASNPVAQFKVQSTSAYTLVARVYTLAGELLKVLRGGEGANQLSWDASGLASGIYLCEVDLINSQGGLSGRQTLKVCVIH